MEPNTIPVLADVTVINQAVVTTFAAFRAEEKLSFVRAYDPKVTEIVGYRHAVIRYRNTDGKTTKSAQMVTVPQMKLPDDYLVVLSEKEVQVFLGTLEDAEDKIIRSMLDNGVSNIHWDALGKDKAIDFLTAERVSQRLTKEQIEAWFTVAGKSWCETRAAQICEAKGITDAEQIAKQKAGSFNAYKDRMVKLAAPVPNLGESEATALKNMLKSAGLADDMSKVLLNKLTQILEPKVLDCGDL